MIIERGAAAIRRIAVLAIAAVSLLAVFILSGEAIRSPSSLVGKAMADDDDGGGRGGRGGRAGRGNAGDDDRSYSRKRKFKRYKSRSSRRAYIARPRKATASRSARKQPRRAIAAPVAALPARARNEVVAIGLTPQMLADAQARGYAILAQDTLANSGRPVVRLRVPQGVGEDDARRELLALGAPIVADFNHFYRPNADAACDGKTCDPMALIAWPEIGQCGARPVIAMVDTQVNRRHSSLAGQDIEILRIGAPERPPSGNDHGTGIASLLVGSAASETPGLLPDARLIVADPYYRSGRSDDRADTYDLVRAIELLVSRRPAVVNLSLSGPANVLLADVVAKALAARVAVVAAAGNNGQSAPPGYPAAYAGVIAVTAVDKRLRPYRRASRGNHIDIAAPGVDLWMARGRAGTTRATGTSFAAPYVTAALSVLVTLAPGTSPLDFEGLLSDHVTDLGEKGRDRIFGQGLLRTDGICPAG